MAMHVILTGGPLDGQKASVAFADVQYSTRVGGRRVVYQDAGDRDPATGLPRFVFLPAAPNAGGEGYPEGDDDER
jgi:hypothetical protein